MTHWNYRVLFTDKHEFTVIECYYEGDKIVYGVS